ncbi:Dehydrin DHN1 [Hibiscus syriacus]|uniref:Dehydrin DHN1 n=1 Tax=Hibiscus syriacus TaxID=106335 RepID=A0A6A2W938_HIBSY|nr:late embryogenesis abundant protein-like [Hibiscus syriacus]KAE8654333.1 Dehydrin DHN1 [Hibiscus syriacus]
MADLIDEHGNPIQLTDEHGNPVQLTDEHGNPVYVTGVATKHPGTTRTPSGLMGPDTGFAADHPQQKLQRQQKQQQPLHWGVSSGGEKIHRSNSSSSSSSEDDGKGGRRKKGLKEKVKEKLSGGKFPEEEQSGTRTEAIKTTTLGQHHQHDGDGNEKKGIIEKIKEKLPGHHGHKH